MPRRQNYSYERNQRERAKAAKRDAKRAARADARSAKEGDPAEGEAGTDDAPGSSDVEMPPQPAGEHALDGNSEP